MGGGGGEGCMERGLAAEPSDEELVARIQRGDDQAFAVIFHRHYRRLARFLRSLGVPDSDVEDLAAETFCRALNRIDQFDLSRGKRYLAYLYAVARNLATDRLRHRPVTLTEIDADPDVAFGDTPREDTIVDQILRMEQVHMIRRAMERLSASDREILVLAYDRELSCREIQAITGKPSISAVTTHVYKAMKKLRGHVQELQKVGKADE
jgi:RNA polymerase sigma-70 factor, ECF subfamily